jgi:hypothetical protein
LEAVGVRARKKLSQESRTFQPGGSVHIKHRSAAGDAEISLRVAEKDRPLGESSDAQGQTSDAS